MDLALRFHPALINRAEAWAEEHGVGSGASRLVTGNLDLFARIEAKVAALKQMQAALVMASGFQANASVLQALFDRSVLGAEPLVFSDRLNHASIHFGCAASGARETRYRHRDAAHLASLLGQYQGDDRAKFILTESVFSMDGDVAPLVEIGRLAREQMPCSSSTMLTPPAFWARAVAGCRARRMLSSALSPRRLAVLVPMSPAPTPCATI